MVSKYRSVTLRNNAIVGKEKSLSDKGKGQAMKTKTNPEKITNICKFYSRGKCQRGRECRFEHPNICQKFKQFGLMALNEKGCAEGCKAYHPNACRDSRKKKNAQEKNSNSTTSKAQPKQTILSQRVLLEVVLCFLLA